MKPFSGIVWRILFSDQAQDVLLSVKAPEGRFHHAGQFAIYTSLTPEGAGVAIQRYLKRGDPPRIIVPIQIDAKNVVDLRTDEQTKTDASIVWHDLRDQGLRVPTWDISDAARSKGAQAMLYASRSRPELTHLVLLDASNPGFLQIAGAARHWP